MTKFWTSQKREFIFAVFVLVVVALVSWVNYQVSLARSRDATRMAQVSDVARSLDDYYYDFGSYPPADNDGQILACGGRPCYWGGKFDSYMTLPNDPLAGRHYFYQVATDGASFKVWAALEMPKAIDRPPEKVIPWCGNAKCTYRQVGSGGDPDKY